MIVKKNMYTVTTHTHTHLHVCTHSQTPVEKTENPIHYGMTVLI